MTAPSVTSEETPLPRSPGENRTLFSLAVQFVANGVVYSSYLARLPEIRDRAGIAIGAMGVILTIANLAGLGASFFTGRVIGWLGSKRVMIAGGLLYVLGLPAIGLSRSPAVLIAALVGLMVMSVFLDVALNLQASVVSSRRHYPVMQRSAGLFSLGTVAGGLIASAVIGWGVGVALHLTVVAAVLAVAVAVVGPGLLPVDEAHPEQAAPEQPRRRWLLVGPAALALGIAGAMAVPLDIVPGEWATFRLTDDLQAGARAGAIAYLSFALGMTAGRFGGDAVVVRIGRIGLARWGPAVSAAGLLIAAIASGPALSIAGFFVAGLGIAVISPLLADAAARAPGPPGSGFTVMLIGDRLAGFGTPLAIGSLASNPHLGVGGAMLIVALPSAVLLALTAVATVRHQQSR